MAKHKADGLYYVTYDMLARNGACSTLLTKFLHKFGRKAKVPVTLDLAVEFEQLETTVSWVIGRLLWKKSHLDALTDRYYDRADAIFSKYGYSDNEAKPKAIARAGMDFLWQRAKLEGLVQS